MTMNKFSFFVILIFLSFEVFSQEYSPAVNKNYPKKLLWGDTHLHSNQSADAWSIGNSNLTPSDAFRFARGEEVVSETGVKAKLRVPLDFLMVSDHATYLGVFKRIENSDPLLLSTDLGKRWREYMDNDDPRLFTEFVDGLNGNQDQSIEKEIYEPIWKEITENVDRFNDPGVFTAFIGYEWTPMPTGDNLHRVVVFRDGASKASQIIPFSALDSDKPEDLWDFLENYSKKTGGEAISISHNSNISGGRMFSLEDSYGEPIDQAYANMRNRWEPLVEATQVKGDSETHPAVSPDDPFADYETWEGNIARTEIDRLVKLSNTGDCANSENYKCYRFKKSEEYRYKGSYVRPALRRGLEVEKKIGVNPYKFGVIGSSDNHTALAASAEDNFFGKFVDSEPGPGRMNNCMAGCERPDAEGSGDLWRNWLITASGYAGVWARENTREEIFDAFKRKETYATTGPRIAVRFFGGWEFTKEDSLKPNFVDIGYTKGVPMGADLAERGKNKKPNFLVMVSKDPIGANIERVHIIKGWIDSKGKTQEKVYDIYVADDAGQSTVNVNNATYDNSIGDPYVLTFWEDKDFNKNYSSFYYVRVLEIPTPRWTTYDSVVFGIDIPSYVPKVHQERAYTSAIWYNP